MNLRRTYVWVALAAAASMTVMALTGFDPLHMLQLFNHDTGAKLLAEGGAVSISSTVLAEQIAKFKAKLNEAREKLTGIVSKSIEEGRTLDEHESEQRAQLVADIKSVENHLVVLEEQEKLQVSKATVVQPGERQGNGVAHVPGASVVSMKRNLPPGTAFTRYCMAMAAAKGNPLQAERLAESFKDTPEVGNAIKAFSYLGSSSGDDIAIKTAVAAGDTSNSTWAGPLVQYNDMVSEFIELLRPMTILGRLNSVRRVPFNIRLSRQTSGSSSQFVGEGNPAPVNKPQFDNVTLPWAKASTIVVITAELARMSNPAAEGIVRQDLLDGCAQYLDKRLVDPAYAGVANVSPASLTNGVTAVQSSGATLAALDANVREVMTNFANAELSLGTGVWVMDASTAIRLSMMRTNQDSKAFPDLSVTGGTFYGLPVIVSNNVAGSGSPGDKFLILIDQREVLLADDGQMLIDVSTEASIEMNDAPTGGATSLRSLWQNGLLGIKCDRWIYWTKRRSQAVQFIDKAQSYGS